MMNLRRVVTTSASSQAVIFEGKANNPFNFVIASLTNGSERFTIFVPSILYN